MDLRTSKGQQELVIKQIKDNGGFSVFWATENQTRACVIDRLEDSGIILRIKGDLYPWMAYRVSEDYAARLEGENK